MIKICSLGEQNIRFTVYHFSQVLVGVISRQNSNFHYFVRKHEGVSGHSGHSEFTEVGTG